MGQLIECIAAWLRINPWGQSRNMYTRRNTLVESHSKMLSHIYGSKSSLLSSKSPANYLYQSGLISLRLLLSRNSRQGTWTGIIFELLLFCGGFISDKELDAVR